MKEILVVKERMLLLLLFLGRDGWTTIYYIYAGHRESGSGLSYCSSTVPNRPSHFFVFYGGLRRLIEIEVF